MSTASLACTRCGTAIPEEDLETGAAISVLGRSYCAGCKGQAVQDISLDELMDGASSPPPRPSPLASPQPPPPRTPAPRSPSEAKGASKAAPPAAPTPRVSSSSSRNRPETRRMRLSEIRRPSKAPLVAGAAVALLAVVVTAVLVLRDPAPPVPTPPPPDPISTTPEKPPTPADTRAEKAQAAYATAEMVARRSERNFDEILSEIDKARGACQGTPFEARLEGLRNEILKEKDIVEGTRVLNPLLEELKAAVAADARFARYPDLMSKFEKARELASRSAPTKIGDLNNLQSDYTGRYEREAELHYPQILEYATAMADEKRFDAALKKIDTFPPYLRHSGSWRALERLRQDIERRKAASK